VNPKAETVEDLQGRRKALHLGMCKLLREDLVLVAESRHADCSAISGAGAIKERITQDFDSQTREHEGVDAAAYNDDNVYRHCMFEAIDGKAHAITKMEVYLESAAAGRVTDLVFNAALKDFDCWATTLRLRTGITAFPWEDVVKERSPDIDLDEWDAALVSEQARELVAGALQSNRNVRSVTVKGVKLALSDGWATTEIKWEQVPALPVTVALLVRNCTLLSTLDIRQVSLVDGEA
jgi:hypothetical protein